MQTSGFVSEGHPEVVHQEAANMNALFVGPVIAKTANAYIKQLEDIRCTGFVTPVQVARKTEDGRNVVDRGLWPNKQDILLQGTVSSPHSKVMYVSCWLRSTAVRVHICCAARIARKHAQEHVTPSKLLNAQNDLTTCHIYVLHHRKSLQCE